MFDKPVFVATALLSVVLMAVAGGTLPAGAQGAGAPCRQAPGGDALDFWLGTWDVYDNGQPVGANHIESALDGCAVFEHWVNAAGAEGKSLFAFSAATGVWTQLWVTDNTSWPGSIKLKRHQGPHDDGSVRFQTTVEKADGSHYLDRTTLTPVPDGTVRQVIEISLDDGKTWQTMFNAEYRRQTTP